MHRPIPIPLWTALLLAGLCASRALAVEELKPDQLYKQCVTSVVAIHVKGKDGSRSSGSGFMAIKDGLALTSFHVIRGAATVSARFSDGEEFDASGLVDKDEVRDLALIRVKVAGRPLLPISKEVAPGAQCYAIGSPKGLDFSVSGGLVSQLRTLDKVQHVQFSAPVSPGNSGGPLLDGSGAVIAVVSMARRDGQNLNFGVLATYALGLDSTLPTTAWADVRTKPAEPASTATTDGDLASAYVNVRDAASAWLWVGKHIIQKKNGFRAGVPTTYHSLRRELIDDAAKLAALSSSDPLRDRIRDALMGEAKALSEAMELCARAIVSAQQANGWAPAASDLASRGIAAARAGLSLKAEQDIFELASQDGPFAKGIPLTLREAVLKTDKGPTLGVWTFARNSTMLLDVVKDGLADKMGLEAGDSIQEVGEGEKVTSLSSFKAAVRRSVGQTLLITVVRAGKAKTLKAKVPDSVGG